MLMLGMVLADIPLVCILLLGMVGLSSFTLCLSQKRRGSGKAPAACFNLSNGGIAPTACKLSFSLCYLSLCFTWHMPVLSL